MFWVQSSKKVYNSRVRSTVENSPMDFMESSTKTATETPTEKTKIVPGKLSNHFCKIFLKTKFKYRLRFVFNWNFYFGTKIDIEKMYLTSMSHHCHQSIWIFIRNDCKSKIEFIWFHLSPGRKQNNWTTAIQIQGFEKKCASNRLKNEARSFRNRKQKTSNQHSSFTEQW